MSTDVTKGAPYGRNLIKQEDFAEAESYLDLYSRIVTDASFLVVVDSNRNVVWSGS